MMDLILYIQLNIGSLIASPNLPISTENSFQKLEGTWSEFGCKNDRMHIFKNGRIRLELWAGEEYGWLTETRFLQVSDGIYKVQQNRNRKSPVLEEWELITSTSDKFIVRRESVDGTPREIEFKRC